MVVVLELADGTHYFGVQGIHGWEDPPILSNPSETKTINGREYDIFVDSGRIKLIAWHRGDNSYWVSNDLLQSSEQRPDGRDGAIGRRDRAEEKAKAEEEEGMSEQREPVGVIGVGWVGLVTAACFAELGHPVIARDILPEKVESLSRGEVTIHEPGLAELVRRNAERITFTTEMSELLERRPPALRLRRHAADLLRRRRPLAGPRRGRGAARRQRARADHEEHGPGRDRRVDPPRPARPAPTSPAPSSSRRARRSPTSCTPTGS